MKRFMVSTKLRLPSNGMRVLFCIGVSLAVLSLVGLLYSLISSTDTVLGPAIIAAVASFLWLFAVRAISEANFGGSVIGFDESGIEFKTSEQTYRLSWDDCTDCGMIRNLFARWIYASDHRLTDAEKKNFPENVEKGVMYFCYQKESWAEFVKFVPEQFRDEFGTQRIS